MKSLGCMAAVGAISLTCWAQWLIAPGRAEDSLAADNSSGATALTSEPTAAELEFFESKVRPLLDEHCYACHSVSAEKLQAGLRVDSRSSLIEGGESGAAIVPGDVDASLLIASVRYESYEMPPKGKLPDDEIATLERWVEMGAPWTSESGPQTESNRASFDLKQRAAGHWAWHPLAHPAPPQVNDLSWPLGDIDRFILARLEQSGLVPATDVDRPTLLRRLCFDLLGLPPTAQQLTEFLADSRPTHEATASLVDRLLESPHFGERWARHWLDLVRYAESRGHEFDDEMENAYQYRDYVIRALNADVPYDQFVREHIAGDLLDQPRLHPTQGFNESILGTGFWFLGEWVHSPVDIRKDETDRFDNMIDVMSKTFLGVTVACARCHDHKFDAISSADYYALSGFLQSSDYRQVRFDTIEQERAIARKLDALDADYRGQIESLLTKELAELDASRPRWRGVSGLANEVEANEPKVVSPDSKWDATDISELRNSVALVTAYLQSGIGLLQDGFVFGSRPRMAGELTVGDDLQLHCAPRTAAASDPFWRGLISIGQKALSRSSLSPLPCSGRTLRTETFDLKGGEVWCRVRGAGHVFACVDSHRLLAGPLHAQTLQTIDANQPWIKLDLSRYVGHRLHLEFTPDVSTQLEVSAVLQACSPQELAEAKQAIEQHQQREEKWAALRQQRLAELQADEPTLGAQIAKLAAQWNAQRSALQASLPETSRVAMAMMDGVGEDDCVLIRGSSSNPGRREPRHFLTALSGDQPLTIAHGSGRLELAAQINGSANPLPSRVIVNRLWHHLMGRGIVPTTDDFGVLGLPPTHPQLLDFLATQFLADGQSIKRMIRAIVLTRTYRMSSTSDSHASSLDPNNDLWHYRPPKRLEGEAIRDALLAISGELDATMYGEPIPIHLTPFMDGRGRPAESGPLTGNGRRSIYIAVRRNFLSPFMLAFDTPSPFSTMGRRNSSNVPAQALILMNDPMVIEQTQHWAERGIAEVPLRSTGETPHDSVQGRVDWFYVTGLGRLPRDRERTATRQFISAQAQQRSLALDAPELWQELAHALVNTKEFIFVR